MQDHKKELIDLTAQHKAAVEAAEAAKSANNAEEFGKKLAEAQALNGQIAQVKALVVQQELHAAEEKELGEADEGERAEKAASRGEKLLKGEEISYDTKEVLLALKSTTVATGTIAKPTAVGGEIHDALGNVVSSIIDQVRVVDLTGVSSILEPIEVSDMEAQSGPVATLAGTERTASDPTFTYAKIAPAEVNVTSYIDKNMKRLTPIDYEARVRAMALRALKRKLAKFIMNGDGEASPVMLGIKNAVDYNNAALFQTLNATEITPDLLMEIIFTYGGSETFGSNARLYLTKEDLKKVGELRGTNERKRLFDISFEGNGNVGQIKDGGLIIPFTIHSNLTSLSTATQGESPIQTMVYTDPMNYELGLFGGYSISVDGSYKAAQRMDTILGDMFAGGNLVVKNGAVVVTVPAQE